MVANKYGWSRVTRELSYHKSTKVHKSTAKLGAGGSCDKIYHPFLNIYGISSKMVIFRDHIIAGLFNFDSVMTIRTKPDILENRHKIWQNKNVASL